MLDRSYLLSRCSILNVSTLFISGAKVDQMSRKDYAAIYRHGSVFNAEKQKNPVFFKRIFIIVSGVFSCI